MNCDDLFDQTDAVGSDGGENQMIGVCHGFNVNEFVQTVQIVQGVQNVATPKFDLTAKITEGTRRFRMINFPNFVHFVSFVLNSILAS